MNAARKRLLLATVVAASAAVAMTALFVSSRGRVPREMSVSHAPPPPPSPLDRRVAAVRMAPAPVDVTLERISALYATPIDVDWEAVQRNGLLTRPDTFVHIELQLRNVTLRQVLRKVLASLREGGGLAVNVAEDGRVAIAPLEDPTPKPITEDPPVLRMYDVRDLLAMLEFEMRLGVARDGGTYVCVVDRPTAAPRPPMPDAVSQYLETLIVDTLDANSWRGTGLGTGDSVDVIGGRLVVVLPPEQQGRVARIMDGARAYLRAPYQKGGAVALP